MPTTPRPRLDSSTPVYGAVAALAARLDEGGMDLWAANLRGCVHGETSGERLRHLGLELARLAESPACRRLDLDDAVAAAAELVAAAVGPPHGDDVVLYRTLRDLVDWLRLEGGPRWVRALQDAASVAEDEPRVEAVRGVLAGMVVGARALPEGSVPRARAAAERIARTADTGRVARCAALALRPPA